MFIRTKLTLNLCELFRKSNGIISYDYIENETGKSIQELRQSITNVRKYLERDEAIVFECVRKQGYKRLDDSEKVESTKGFTRRIRRAANQGIHRIGTIVNRSDLSNDDQLTATIQETVLNAVNNQVSQKI